MESLRWLEDAVAPRDKWKGWEEAVGPALLLLGCGASLLANWVWGRMIGDVACSWRLSYSPRGPAFFIWTVIYLWTFVSIALQFSFNMNQDMWYCASFATNALICVTWIACSLWIWFFSLADSKNIKDGLGWAAWLLIVAVVCALSAVCWEQSWRSGSVVRVLSVGVPFSLFAGWLLLAASLSLGVFLASETRPPDRCPEDEEDGELVQVRDPGMEVWVPPTLAVAIGAFAIGLPDPVLPVPLLWGLVWVNRSRGQVLAALLAVVAILGAVLRVPSVVPE